MADKKDYSIDDLLKELENKHKNSEPLNHSFSNAYSELRKTNPNKETSQLKNLNNKPKNQSYNKTTLNDSLLSSKVNNVERLKEASRVTNIKTNNQKASERSFFPNCGRKDKTDKIKEINEAYNNIKKIQNSTTISHTNKSKNNNCIKIENRITVSNLQNKPNKNVITSNKINNNQVVSRKKKRNKIEPISQKIKEHKFLFEELVKRDFTKKYKRTILGMLWSIIGPLMTLGVMAIVFTQFFGRKMEHYIIYMFCGNLLFSYFRESTNGGMVALQANANIFSKVNVPKYMFVLSKSVSSMINFGINLCVLFIFCLFDGITFTWKFVLLIYPICCLVIFNIGMSFILSSLYIMFNDLKYLYDVFTMLLMYVSAIFYSIDAYPLQKQYLFYLNPVYVYIRYFRKIILEGVIPKFSFHLLAAGYAIVALVLGAVIYKKKNYKFLYYI